MTVVSLANLHKRPEALSCDYVTLRWQAEWVKKSIWKTVGRITSPSPLEKKTAWCTTLPEQLWRALHSGDREGSGEETGRTSQRNNIRSLGTPVQSQPWDRLGGGGQGPSPGDGGQRKIKGEAIYIRCQHSTLNRDGSYELPAIFNHFLSRDKHWTIIADEDCAIQSKATRLKSETLRLFFLIQPCLPFI